MVGGSRVVCAVETLWTHRSFITNRSVVKLCVHSLSGRGGGGVAHGEVFWCCWGGGQNFVVLKDRQEIWS